MELEWSGLPAEEYGPDSGSRLQSSHMPAKKNPIARGHERALWLWMEAFSACVRARDFEGARQLFVRDSHGFGTLVKVVNTCARLERMQWAKVWPVTSGFRFERAGARMLVSADQTQAVLVATWKACNQAAPKRMVFDRRGRATVVLRRAGPEVPWKAEHTHFSFDPESVRRGTGSA